MDTNQLKKFAKEARNILKRGVANQLSLLGFDGDGHVKEEDKPQLVENGTIFQGKVLQEESFYHKWMALYHRIEVKGIREVYEEAAYTWFNRLVAIRILEKNNLIAPILTFDNDRSRTPQIVVNARRGGQIPPLSASQSEELQRLLKDDMRTAEQFQLLITAYCETNPILSACFGDITDYTEILLPNNITAANGFLDMLNHTDFIQEEDYHKSELIGWLYQFYISEKKDEVFAAFKDGKKAKAEDIPAATQIFTPNWIVRYMVENTLGRIYLDKNPGSTLEQDMTYLVKPDEPTPTEAKFQYTSLHELTCADLSCGSGHILGEFFNLLLKIYIEEGYLPQQAIEEIFEYNIVGVDLDTRAKQLSTFSLLLKACQLDNSFCDAHCLPNVLDMPEPWKDKQELGRALNDYFRGEETPEKRQQLLRAFALLEQADNLGSIMQFDLNERTLYMMQQATKYWMNLSSRPELVERLLPSMKLMLALTKKYAAICMNPPYMGAGNMNKGLSEYVQNHYPDGKADLFAVFMILAVSLLRDNGKYGMINMQSWMFILAFERLRCALLENYHIDSLLHLGARTFDELSGDVVQNVAYVISKNNSSNTGVYFRLVDGGNCGEKERIFLSQRNNPSIWFSDVEQSDYGRIPGNPIAYWVSEQILQLYGQDTISDFAEVITGMTIGDNKKYLRLWHEVNRSRCAFSESRMDNINLHHRYWLPYSKGGSRRNWYGNYEYVVNWSQRANFNRAKTTLQHLYLREAITWPFITPSKFCARLLPVGSLWDVAGSPCFFDDVFTEKYTLAFMCTNVCDMILKISNPTINVQALDINRLPLIVTHEDDIVPIADKCIDISRQDWDAHETSWDFETNPLIVLKNQHNGDAKSFLLSELIEEFKSYWEERFQQLHQNEEELNRQFIEIYGLQDELTPDVSLEDITILQQGEISIENNKIVWHEAVLIKQLLSYLVGIIMGRYRLDKPGLHIAHPSPTAEEQASYSYNGHTINIDDDAIIPILPEDAPFPDNAAKRVAQLLSVIFGESKLIENINYINRVLGETLETYLQKHIYATHTKMYQKKPIYWLFSSKKGAFQCLAYMHRMNKFTADQIRTKYLLPYIDFLENNVVLLEQSFSDLTSQERKRLERYRKDLEECQEYHDQLHDIANHMIEFDLDDGVTKNYALFAPVLAKIK